LLWFCVNLHSTQVELQLVLPPIHVFQQEAHVEILLDQIQKNIADQVQTSVIMPSVAIVLQDIQLDIHATQLYILTPIQIAHLSIA